MTDANAEKHIVTIVQLLANRQITLAYRRCRQMFSTKVLTSSANMMTTSSSEGFSRR
jgi:hypothetical protein